MSLGFQFFEEVRLVAGNKSNRVRRANCRDGALIALRANFLVDLQEKRTVSELGTPFDAFSAADAEVFIDRVFV